MSQRCAVLDGDVRNIARTLERHSFDGVLCDPPYELSDDGKASAARVALEVLFPEYPNVETNGASESDLSLLIAEVLALSLGRLGPGPSATMPEVPMALDDDAALRKRDVEDARKGAIASANDDGLLDQKTKSAKYLGRFVLECADPPAFLDALNCTGACLYAGSLRIGSRVSLASLPSLLRGGGVVDRCHADIRSLHDAFASAICATPRAEVLPVPSSLALARTETEFLSTSGALALFGTLQLGGAKLVRASSRAGCLPSKLQARRISIVCDATDRALSLDLILHPINMASKGFMGKTWDGSKVAFDVATWTEILRVCKPGAHMLAFGGSRTMHRITCAIEDAGWEIRDSIVWLYGQGFPKSLDVSKAIDKAAGAEREIVGRKHHARDGDVSHQPSASRAPNNDVFGKTDGPRIGYVTAPATDGAKAWNGYGTALKPAHEPIVLARNPLDGTVVENVLKWGCGALAIDACRIGFDPITINRWTDGAKPFGGGAGHDFESTTVKGRWPANILLDEESAKLVDESSGERPGMTGGGVHRRDGVGQIGYGGGMFGAIDSTTTARGDSGGASRFFFTSKASREDRNHGLTHTKLKSVREHTGRDERSEGAQSPRAGAGRQSGSHNNHPTVKPTDLLEYLAKLILPPKRSTPRRLFVPFAGSGSEMIAALRAGWDEVIGIELEYGELCRERLAHADVSHQAELFGQ